MTIWSVLLGLVLILAAFLAVVAFTGVAIRAPKAPLAKPASDPREALHKLAALHSNDTRDYSAPCSSVMMEPADGNAKATIVIFHGFTNCPHQFLLVAEQMRRDGYRVLLPRQPRHGLTNLLNHDLKDLTTDELVNHVAEVMDIAHGWQAPVYVSGLSVGAILACWAGATRPEAVRVLAAAPFAAPKGFPLPVVRLLVFLKRWLPGTYIWWDPRKKDKLGESPYVYPGFPLPGMVPYLHLSEVLASGKTKVGHTLEYVGLTTNPGDFAIRHDCARRLMRREFSAHADTLTEWTLGKDLCWWHDFVDPDGARHGTPEQVAAVWLTALGLTDAGQSQGLMTPEDIGTPR